MLVSLDQLFDKPFRDVDGEVEGKLDDLYVNQSDWSTEYIVVDLQDSLIGRRLLLPPAVLRLSKDDELWADVDVDQLQDSPDVEADLPLPPDAVMQLTTHYDVNRVAEDESGRDPLKQAALSELESADNPIRSARELVSSRVLAQDAESGILQDFIIDTDDWILQYAVILPDNDSRAQRRVLVPTHRIDRFDAHEGRMHLDLPAEQLQLAPAFDPNEPLTEAYLEDIFMYYRQTD